MVIKTKELADKHGYFWPNQFENEANAWIHEQTTGPEIVGAFQTASLPIDHFVCSYGTGGTLLGVGRYLRKHSPNTKIHVCEPRYVKDKSKSYTFVSSNCSYLHL